ncbi:O-acetyl-ADP-ribose deacetylase [Sporolactobacillus kofuensis]|uniref:O-acetyl-ADP-ribose deacetylase n=1 Tax=Sporolactobacillus kofuensis TaxID=269672 RepID=A0ABW1WCP4_9BACL|nr:O-acetyl-ADP-ribose deacetylase [Sporolactobacillus kofuensis]MCO7175356.1 O-acetyl-ADP-ribose deacetylase [Sporolactobacillus kofuensis]
MKSFSIMLGDITKVKADAIVNAANTTLLGGGGVDGAIHRAAGPQLLEECRALNGCATGEAKITKGYRLPASYVIHTPGPIWQGGHHHEADLLRNSYLNSLKLAEANTCHSIVFPSISTGVYHFPLNLAAPIAVQTIRQFLNQATAVEAVQMICFDEETKRYYDQAFKELCSRS